MFCFQRLSFYNNKQEYIICMCVSVKNYEVAEKEIVMRNTSAKGYRSSLASVSVVIMYLFLDSLYTFCNSFTK